MSVFEWKSIDLIDLVSLPNKILQNINTDITAQCSNASKVGNGISTNTTVFCDKNGFVHVLFTTWECISFKSQAGKMSIKLCALSTNDILATVTQEDNFSICIHIYDLKMLTKRQGAPCIGNVNLTAYSTACSMQVEFLEHDKTLVLAIGFEMGDVLLHYGAVNRDLSQNFQRLVIGLRAITGIQFETKRGPLEESVCNMFVTGVDGVFCYVLNNKGGTERKLTLSDGPDRKNIHRHSCTMHQPEELSDLYFVAGQDDAIYCFTRDGRGPCYAIEGKKRYLSWVDHYLVVIVENVKSVFTHQTSAALIVVDIRNKIIIFNKQIEDVFSVISKTDSTYIITKNESDYNLVVLQERDTKNKISLLVEKHMYEPAICVLERKGLSNSQDSANVHFQYGNHLFTKGEIVRAVSEYIQTIGFVKPYDVISKLLSSRHNEHLMQYLNVLVKSKHASNKHKKLLRTCIERENLCSKVQQLCTAQDNTLKQNLRFCDLKNISFDAGKLLNILDKLRQLEENKGLDYVLEDEKENEIIQFFVESGHELLSEDPQVVLKTIKSLVNNKKITHTLSLLTIFSDQLDFCANSLAEVIKNDPHCDEKLYYYLLVLYLELWRKQKISEEHILEFLKNSHLRLEQVLIICKVYLFSIGMKHFLSTTKTNDVESYEDVNLNKCVEVLIKNNPHCASMFGKWPRSLLFILHSVCNNDKIEARNLRSFFLEENMQTLMDSNNDFQSINKLNGKIEKYSSLLANFKESPIEFRNSSCDICRQVLRLPSIFFLCQHSFHKDCLNFHSHNNNVCPVCFASNHSSSDASENEPVAHSLSDKIIQEISTMIGSGVFHFGNKNDLLNLYQQISTGGEVSISGQAKKDIPIPKNPFEQYSTNPFENYQDSNSNGYT